MKKNQIPLHPFRTFFFLFLSLMIINGCMVGPNYKTPKTELSVDWQKEEKNLVAFLNKEPTAEWWQIFQDTLLTKYLQIGVENNKDLLQAEANILQARALRQVAASKFYPQIGFNTSASRMEYSKNGIFLGKGKALAPAMNNLGIQSLFNFLFDASWEVDLFGKTRRSVQAAEAQIGSAIESRNDLLISIMAEISRNYMEIRSFQKRKELVENDLALIQQTLEVLKQGLNTGYKNLFDVETLEAELSTANATLPDLIAQIYRGIYALSALTGQLPETFVDELLQPKSLPQAPLEINVGVRSDLLRRRPDIRKAERELATAIANVGVSVADFYPSFLLGLGGGLQSTSLKNLFNLHSKTWLVGGDMNLPIFRGGKLVGNLKASRAVAAAAGYQYQQTILNALAETESAIKKYAEDVDASQEQKKSVETNQSLVTISKERFQKGLVNVIGTLNEQRKLIAAKQTLLSYDTQSLLDVIALYKALGGEWQPSFENSEKILKVLDSCIEEKKSKKRKNP
jgi:outer membrane protein, multidrug efflux system